ncbi:MAG TPA: serine/threonine-protein kinase [Pyrinomonadaceae bacterium]|nr:serine/threonine-protein kinase [Pyrinomonadaceae bacterium]
MKKCPKCEKTYEDTTTLCPSDGAVLEKDGDGLIGQTLADKYRVEELISQGGMGTVYRGTHILMDKTVAIKVLNPSLAADDVIVQRFSREARAASRISHPHALNVTDFGESQNGVVFLIMEYLRGKTLKEVVQGEGRLALPRVTEIIRQVCGALDAAHAEGVVHRDLKSDNIMLVDVGGGDWAKVLDFGIAKIKEPVGTQDSALTSPNLIIGTPQYMSPEQCSQAAELDARSDIYSLGVILYEMLAGHVPFMGESPTAIMMKHLQEPAPSLMDERKDVPAAVGRVVARALAKRPEERFQSAGELSEALSKASEMAAPAAVAAETSASDDVRSTNRIIVPTDSNELVRDTSSEVQDESTIVRQRPVREEQVESEAVIFQDAPPPVETFNPWRIIVPAFVGLILVFGVIWALTRNPNPQPANQQNAPLVVDPNSSNVQPMQSPTGQAEQGVASSTTTNTNQNSNSATGAGQTQTSNSASTGANSNSGGDKNPPRNDNAQPEPTPTDDNSDDDQPEPTPKPSESPVETDEPPPMPKPKKKPPRELPKPELPSETPATPPLGDAPTAP